MKRLLPLCLALILSLVPPLCGHAAEEPVLNILTWADYIDTATILTPFEEEYGVRINYDYFDSNEQMLEKLEALEGGTYDIILASDYIIDIARNRGLLQKLDKAKLSNWENIDPTFLNQFFDPDAEYIVPYVAGTPLIVYDPAYVDIEITGYNSLWDPSLKDSLVLIDDARNIIGITLKSLGYSFNTTDPAALEEAGQKLLALKENVRVLDYNTPHLAMISGEAIAGYLFTPAVVWALAERPDLKVVYPEEGMGFGIDALFVPSNAPHPDNAHLFLNFLMRPEIAVNIAQIQAYINCNRAAAELLPEEMKSNSVLYIPSEQLGETEFIQDVGDALPIYDKIWTDFKQY